MPKLQLLVPPFSESSWGHGFWYRNIAVVPRTSGNEGVIGAHLIVGTDGKDALYLLIIKMMKDTH